MNPTKENILQSLEKLKAVQSEKAIKLEADKSSNSLDIAYESGKISGYTDGIDDFVILLGKCETTDEFAYRTTNMIKELEPELIKERDLMPMSDETMVNEEQTKKKGTVSGKILALVDMNTMAHEISGELARLAELERQKHKSRV